MKIGVCEDEKSIAQTLALLIEKFMKTTNSEFTVETFCSGKELLEKDEEYDLLFLDCVLPDVNGIELAKTLRKNRIRSTIVFVTAYADYVFESFEVGTFRYVLKPIEEDKINKILSDYMRSFHEEAYINIPTARKENIVDVHQIVYIESDGKYSIVRLSNDSFFKSLKPISYYQQKIAETYNVFFRTHRRFIVNMEYIDRVNGNVIVFSNGENAEISRRNLSQFSDRYMSFLKHFVK